MIPLALQCKFDPDSADLPFLFMVIIEGTVVEYIMRRENESCQLEVVTVLEGHMFVPLVEEFISGQSPTLQFDGTSLHVEWVVPKV